jgi:hypothetical protein
VLQFAGENPTKQGLRATAVERIRARYERITTWEQLDQEATRMAERAAIERRISFVVSLAFPQGRPREPRRAEGHPRGERALAPRQGRP